MFLVYLFPNRLLAPDKDAVELNLLEEWMWALLRRVWRNEKPTNEMQANMFSLCIRIGKKKFDNTILDLGASFSIMPVLVYYELQLSNLHATGLVDQLLDYSLLVKPLGDVKDVLVEVIGLVFLPHLYVLNVNENISPS